MSDSDFEVFRDKGGPGRGSIENPTVRITSRKISLGSAIHREIFDDAERIEFLIDAANSVIGLRPIQNDADEKPHAYSAGSNDVSCRSVWLEMGVEIEASHEVALDVESQAFPTIDVSPFVGGDPHEHGTDDSVGVMCEVCGDVFDTERGRNVHHGRTHARDANEASEFECADCGETFESETGRNIHAGQMHGGDKDQQQDESQGQNRDHADTDTRNGGGNDPGQTEYPCPVCGEAFDSTQEMRSHRDDAHDETEIKRTYREQVREDLPSHVSITDVEATAAASSNVYQMTEELRMPRDRLKPVVGKLGLGDVLDEHGEAQACHLVEDLHDELGIDEPLPDVPGETAGGEAA